MHARCTENPEHKRFLTVAHIMEEWEVDESGGFIQISEPALEVVHGPDVGNIWACAICGVEAEVTA